VKKFTSILSMAVAMILVSATEVFAQAAGAAGTVPNAWIEFGGAFGVGLTVIGAAYGIGKLASSALESMARQPEVAGSIQTAMIIAAALIEGFTFYALFICSSK
jgi:F-type H+-transporting ATPase subunit c